MSITESCEEPVSLERLRHLIKVTENIGILKRSLFKHERSHFRDFGSYFSLISAAFF